MMDNQLLLLFLLLLLLLAMILQSPRQYRSNQMLNNLSSQLLDEQQEQEEGHTTTSASYGIDVSFPVQGHVSQNYDYLPHNVDPLRHPTPAQHRSKPIQPLGDRHQLYLQHLDGCRKAFAPQGYSQWCDSFEYDRLLMNQRQPQSMINLTETGFKKVRAPDHLTKLLTEFWEKHKSMRKQENWGVGNAYLNHWDKPTEMVSVDDKGLRGSGTQLKREIWAALSALMEEWTQQEVQPSSLYGIRVYHEGAIMMPHVDRLPLVASAIINVAQDVDEDWPTEIYDHDGQAHNITMHPGEMLLFESASCIHGHPFPLKGNYYASIFVHFEPTGKSLGMDDDGYYFLKGDNMSDDVVDGGARGSKKEKAIDEQYHESSKNRHGGQSSSFDGVLPPYIQRASPEEKHWLEQHRAGWKPPAEILPPEAHIAAKKGELKDLELKLEECGKKLLTERDENGWQLLHQGVAGGYTEVVEFLIRKGADVNARTHGGYGETPLRIAEKRHGKNSTLVQYLKKMGALSIGPEL